MRAMLFVILGAFWAANSNAACERNEHGVFEDVACAASAAGLARKEMEEVYQRVRAQVFPHARDALEESQQAWKAYRQASVKFIYAQEGDGSAGRMVAANNEERAIRARIVELAEWLPRK